MKASIKYYFLLCLIFLSGHFLRAQLVPYTKIFSEDIHGGYNQTWQSVQAPNHKMYFANTGGLLEYNGTRWNKYPLPNNRIPRSIYADSLGRIFAGGYKEMGFWEKNDVDSMVFHSLVSLLNASALGQEEIWHITPFGKKIIFQSFSKLFIYDGDTIISLLPPGNIMYAVEIDNQLIVPVIDSGLFVLSRDLTFSFLTGTERLSDKKVTTILPFGKKELLIGTAHQGLFIWKDGRLVSWQTPIIEQLQRHQINTGVILKNDLLAFGTIQNGIYVLDKLGQLVYQLNQKNALSNNTVLHLYEDKTGLLWAGLDNGISLTEIQSPVISYQDKIGSIGTTYAGVVFDNKLYIGTNQGVFYSRLQPSFFGLQILDFPLNKVEGTQGQVWDLEVAGNQLLCAHNEGSFVIHENGAQKIANIGAWKWVRNPYDSLMLFQANYNGIAIFKQNKQHHWQYKESIKGLSTSINELIFVARNQALISSPYQGVKKIILNDKLNQVVDIHDITMLGDNVGISEWQGKIIVHTAHSNTVFDPFSMRVRPFSDVSTGQEGRIIDGQSNNWFSVTPESMTIHKATKSRTIPLRLHNEFECITPLQDNLFLVGLDNGFSILNLNRVHQRNRSTPPSIDYVEIQRPKQKLKMGAEMTRKGLTLPANTQQITIYYSNPNYLHQEPVTYALDGLGIGWQPAQNGKVVLQNIPSGKFLFRLKSEHAELTFPITVQPKWYVTGWAYLVYGLILFGILFLLYRWHLLRLRKQEYELEQKRLEQQKEIEAKQREKERQLQEQLIKSENERLQFDIKSKSKELANAAISLAKYNEALIEIKEELKRIKDAVPTKDFGIQKTIKLLESNLSDQSEWQVFKTNFNQIHEKFMKNLQAAYPNLNQSDLQLAAYLRMGLSSKEIAPILSISVRGLENKRYRLRKKMGLTREDNLVTLLEGF